MRGREEKSIRGGDAGLRFTLRCASVETCPAVGTADTSSEAPETVASLGLLAFLTLTAGAPRALTRSCRSSPSDAPPGRLRVLPPLTRLRAAPMRQAAADLVLRGRGRDGAAMPRRMRGGDGASTAASLRTTATRGRAPTGEGGSASRPGGRTDVTHDPVSGWSD